MSTARIDVPPSSDSRSRARPSVAITPGPRSSLPPPPPPTPQRSTDIPLVAKERKAPAGSRRWDRHRVSVDASRPDAVHDLRVTRSRLSNQRAGQENLTSNLRPNARMLDLEPINSARPTPSAVPQTEPAAPKPSPGVSPSGHPFANEPSLSSWVSQRPLGWVASPTHPHYAERAFKLPGSQRRFALWQAVDAELSTPAGRFVAVSALPCLTMRKVALSGVATDHFSLPLSFSIFLA